VMQTRLDSAGSFSRLREEDGMRVNSSAATLTPGPSPAARERGVGISTYAPPDSQAGFGTANLS